MKKLLLALFFAVTAIPAQAEMSPEEYLNKISERLTGSWATPQEFDLLNAEMARTRCSRVSCLKSFFQTYTRTKLNTNEFYNEAVLKVFERMGFQSPNTVPFPFDSSTGSQNTEGRELLLSYRVFRHDLSLDEIYTSQTYWQRQSGNSGGFNFGAFDIETESAPTKTDISVSAFSQIDPKTKLEEVNYIGHANVSGLFTTGKFTERYWNSPINGNRKRAAAFYRIMLCFPMTPALEREKMTEREEALAKGVPELTTGTRSLEEIHKNRHASQRDCAKCHDLLEPVAQTMRPMELGLSKFGFKGKLRMHNGLNHFDEVEVSGFSDLIKKATKMAYYEDCQVNWLFNWIVGKDVSLHPARFQDILGDFKDSNRRAKSMVEKLVLSPEFRGEKANVVEAPSFKKAMAVFTNCQDCHTPFFYTNRDNMKVKLFKISRKLDLPNDGANRMMPPADHWWAPSASDIQDIKNWIREGAPLTEGKPVLNEQEIQKALGQAVTR